MTNKRKTLLHSTLAFVAGVVLSSQFRPDRSEEEGTQEGHSRTTRSQGSSSSDTNSSANRFADKLSLLELLSLTLTEQAAYLLHHLDRDPAFALGQALELYRAQGVRDYRKSHLDWVLTHAARNHRAALLALARRDDLSTAERAILKAQLAPGNLAAADPMQLAEQKLSGKIGPGSLGQILLEASRENPGQAFLLFERALLEHPSELSYVDDKLMVAMAGIDPTSFLRLIDQTKSFYLRGSMVQGYVAAIGKESPEAAQKFVESLPSGQSRVLGSIRLANVLAQVDHNTARDWIDANLSGKTRRLAMAAAATPELIRSDPKLVLEWFKSESANLGLPGSDTFSTIASKSRGGTSATGWQLSPYPTPTQVVERSLRLLAETDRQSALETAWESFPSTYNPSPFNGSSLAGRLVADWVDSDPRAALTWLQDKDSKFLNAVLKERRFAYGYRDASLPELLEAIALTDQIADERSSAVAQGRLVSSWTHRPEDLVNLLDRSEDQLFFTTFSTLTTADPDRAISELHRLPNERRAGAQSAIVRQLANSSPARALEYAQTLPEAEQDYHNERAVLTNWTRNDIHGAHQWLRSQEASARIEKHFVTLAKAVQYQGGLDPALVVPDLERLSDASLRNSAYNYLIPAWAELDRDAAQRALQQASLTNRQRDALQSYLTPREDAP